MYLTAHRVFSRRINQSGVNAFLYEHGTKPPEGVDWGSPDVARVANFEPGTLVNQRVALPVGGNEVQAYLDVAAADGTSGEEIERALDVTERRLDKARLPLRLRGPVSIQFGAQILFEGREVEVFRELRACSLALLGSARPSLGGGPIVIRVDSNGGTTVFFLDEASRARLQPIAPQAWRPAQITVGQDEAVNLAYHRGNVMADIVLAVLNHFPEGAIGALGGIEVRDSQDRELSSWPPKAAAGTGYCLQCHQHNTLRPARNGFRCLACGHEQENNGLWVSTLQ
jgi:hypothetical protein